MRKNAAPSRKLVDIDKLIGDDTEARRSFDEVEEALEKADLVRQIRMAAQLDVDGLARRLDVEPAYVRDLEAAHLPEELTYTKLRHIALICGVQWPTEPRLRH
jgi:hypothetical protein